MSAERIFFNIFMLLFIWYILNRYLVTYKVALLVILFGQFFSFVLSFSSMVSGIKANVFVQVLTSVFGIIIPGFIFLYHSLNKSGVNQSYWKIRKWLDLSRFFKKKNGDDMLLLGDGSEDIFGLAQEVRIISEKHVEDLIKAYNCPADEIPSSVKTGFMEVQKLIDTKAYRKALETYLTLEKQFSDNAALQFNIGNMYYRLGDYSNAARRYEKALSINSQYEKKQKGETRSSQKTAAQRVKKVLMRIEDYEILFNTAVCLLAQGKYDNAIGTFKKAGESKGNWTNIYYPLGITYERLERFPEAVEMYKNLCEIYPDEFEIHRKVAEFLCKLGDYKQSRAYINKAVGLEPDYIDGYIALGNCLLNNEQYKDAIEAYKEAIKIDPELSELHYNLGIAFYANGQKVEAMEEYKKAIGLNENDYKSYYNLGVVLDELGEKEDAVLRFQHCLDIKPDFYEASNNLAIVLCTVGEYKEAMETYIKALQYNPTNHELYFNLAITLECQGREEHAEELYNKIIKMKPDFFDAYYNLAVIMCNRGDLQGAEECLRKATECEGHYAKAYYQLARIYAMSREYGRCIDNLNKAINLSREYIQKAREDSVFDDIRNLKGFENAVQVGSAANHT